MKKQECKKRVYEAPECNVIRLESELDICVTSVRLDVPNTTEEDWDEHEVEGGEFDL